MSMFNELYAIATTATLSMLISADEKTGKLTISVVPKPKKDLGEAALTKDLTLTATPEEFDSDFVTVLTGYREARQGLIEQAETTNEVLAAAKTASGKKAVEAVGKAAKQTAKPAPQSSTASDEDDDEAADDKSAAKDAKPNAQGEANYELQLFG